LGRLLIVRVRGSSLCPSFVRDINSALYNVIVIGARPYSSMVNFARCKVLGANVLRGPNQKPWDGKLNYDYQLWIAKEQGHEIWCDPRIRVGHEKIRVI
jgi:hypothetical protein